MNLLLFIVLLFGLQAICLIVGKKASKHLKDQDDYFLAGKSVRFFPLMMTFLATQVGGGLILGAAEEAYQFGWSVFFYPLGATLGLLVLGLGIGKKLAQFKVSTVAQILEVVYGSPVLRKIASILSVISLFMILIAQVIASQKFLFSLGVTNPFIFIGFWAIVVFYTVQGGMKAVVATDIIQAAFFMIVFLFCLGFAMYVDPISFLPSTQLSQTVFVPSKLCGWLFMPLLFMVIEQDMAQRCFAGKSPSIVSKASLVAGICTLIICVVPIFFGVLGKVYGIDVPQGASVLMTMVAKMTNPWITAVVGCAILAAIISTADSLINAISSNLSSDFSFRFLQKKNPVRFVQAMTAVISIAAIFCSFYFNNVVDLLIQSYELSVSCLFVPIFFALFKKQGSFLSALLAMLCGVLGFCLFRIVPIAFPKEIISVVLSLLGYGVGELILSSKARRVESL